MIIGKVVGTVICTRKNDNLIGSKFMIIEPLVKMGDEQSKIAGRIAVIENILKNYELIGEEANNLGKWVKVEFIGLEEDDDPVQVYKIVGTLEADPLQQLISNECPLGRAIINHGVGEQVYVKPEEGEEFWAKILEISSEEIK